MVQVPDGGELDCGLVMAKKRRNSPRYPQYPAVVRSHPPTARGSTSGATEITGSWDISGPSPESTTAPPLGASGSSTGYASTASGLAAELLHGKRPINLPLLCAALVALWFSGVTWLFLQDNAANRLSDWSAVWWFMQKAGVLTLFGFVAVVVVIQIVKFHNRVVTPPSERSN